MKTRGLSRQNIGISISISKDMLELLVDKLAIHRELSTAIEEGR